MAQTTSDEHLNQNVNAFLIGTIQHPLSHVGKSLLLLTWSLIPIMKNKFYSGHGNGNHSQLDNRETIKFLSVAPAGCH